MSDPKLAIVEDQNRRLSTLEREATRFRIDDDGNPQLAWRGGRYPLLTGAGAAGGGNSRINSDANKAFVVSTETETWRSSVSDGGQMNVRRADTRTGTFGITSHL